MIVDSSAIIAILRQEAEANSFAQAIAQAESVSMSAATFLETALVVDSRHNAVASRRLDDLLRRADVSVVAVTEEQARIAREAHRDFGRGSGHPARLNFGDLFAYALAKVTGEPLLFKGNDFIHTDITPAVSPQP
jgi:ribonuclease VapC